MLLNVLSKQSEGDAMKQEVKDYGFRIRELEAKVGDPSDISEKLGLAVRNLPLSTSGQSELENVRAALYEIRAPGVEVARDITKAVRVGAKEDYLGTVKVEMLNDASRASIMKNKRSLGNHQNPVIKNLIIKNLKSEDQMRMENFARDVLQILPGGSNYFVAGNGHLRQKGPAQAQHSHPLHVQVQRPAVPRHAAPYRPGQLLHQPYQSGQYGRHQVGNNQYRANFPLPYQPAGAHGQADQVQHQHQQPHTPNQYSHTPGQEVQAVVHPPQVQPSNPLDLFDPFQYYPANPAPRTTVEMPGENRAYGEAPHPPQGGPGLEQATVHDRVANHGQ